MKKQDFNTLYMICLMVLGLIFMILSKYENATLLYIGIGLLSAGLTVGLFEFIREQFKK